MGLKRRKERVSKKGRQKGRRALIRQEEIKRYFSYKYTIREIIELGMKEIKIERCRKYRERNSEWKKETEKQIDNKLGRK